MSDVGDFDFWMGEWTVQNRRLRERLAGSDEWDEFEADEQGVADPRRPRQRGRSTGPTTTAASSGCRSASSTRPRGSGRSTGRTAAVRGCSTRRVIGSFTGDTGVFEGDDTFKGRPIRVRFTWSRVTTPTPALGAGVLGRRRRDLGDELDQRLHARRRRHMTRRADRLPAPDEGDRARPRDRARRELVQVVRHRARRRARAGADPGVGAREPARGCRFRSDRSRRRPRLRDPAPLRRRASTSSSSRRGATTTSSGRPSGRRTATPPASTRGRSRARTGRRSASGSSAPSGTSSRRGAASSIRSATRTRGTPTCTTSSPARSNQRCRAARRMSPRPRARAPPSPRGGRGGSCRRGRRHRRTR